MGDELPQDWVGSRERKRPWWHELVWTDADGVHRCGLRAPPPGLSNDLCWNAPIDHAEVEVLIAADLGPVTFRGSTEPVARWLAKGYDLHEIILPAIRAAASRPGYRPPASLRFFDGWVEAEAKRQCPKAFAC